MRLDALLAARACYPSRSAATKQIDAGKVLVNGEPATKKTKIAAGDVIIYEDLPEEEHIALLAEPIPLDVRYEDDDMLVISKQAGLCVHPAPGHPAGTLVNALLYRYGRDHLAHVQGDDRPGIVHRLDMDTSGLMMCAKTDAAGEILQQLIRDHDVDRRYLTLVHGNIAYDTGQIDEPIGRVPATPLPPSRCSSVSRPALKTTVTPCSNASSIRGAPIRSASIWNILATAAWVIPFTRGGAMRPSWA